MKIPKFVNIKVVLQYVDHILYFWVNWQLEKKIVTSLTHFVNLCSYYVFVSVILIQMTYPKIMKQSGTPAHV